MENKEINTKDMATPKSAGEPADNGVTRLPDDFSAASGAQVLENKASFSKSSYTIRKGE